MLTFSPLTPLDVTDARMVVELGVLPLVVERATSRDIGDLIEIVERAEVARERGEYTMSLSATFHVRVAAASHNLAIEALVHSFYGPMLMSLRRAQEIAPLMGHRRTDEHRALVESIADRDAEEAAAVMRAHLGRTAALVASLAAGGP